MKTKYLVPTIFLLFGFLLFYRIGKASINNDAHFWYTRSIDFIDQVKQRDWVETFQNPKPGVTVMWASGLSIKLFLFLYERAFGFIPALLSYDTFSYLHLSAVGPLLLLVFLTSIALYYLVSSIFNREIAVFTLILLVFQPFVIGLSRNFHADATTMSFMLLSGLTAIYYYTVSRKRKWLLLSGFTAGLALLSKSSAIFLIPYFVLVSVLGYKRQVASIGRHLVEFLMWSVILCITFYVIFPSMWVQPIATLHWIFLDEGKALLTEGRDGVNGFWYYIEPLFRILTPVFVASFFFGLYAIFLRIKMEPSEQRKKQLMIMGFVIFYVLQMSIVKQKMERYLLPAIPFMAIIGACGIYRLSILFKKLSSFVVLFLFLNLSWVAYYFPNYLLYPSVYGKDQFGCSMCSDIGDYLNNQPNPSDLKIISTSQKLHRLQPFVMGRVYNVKEKLPYDWTPEYLVATAQEEVPEEYAQCFFEKSIGFRGVEYWNIFRCK